MTREFGSDDTSWGTNSKGNDDSNERATIGPSITIKGEVSGSEDLMIQGSVEGTVNLRENTVTVGKSAKVKADIFGKSIHVQGEIVGNLNGSEQIVVHKTGYVRGNITAPRLSLEDGARIKGAIDTEPQSQTSSHEVERIRTATTITTADEALAKAKAATTVVTDSAKRTQLNGARTTTTL